MFTDLKDFSKKMQKDEAGTLLLIEKYKSIVGITTKKYEGNVIKSIGDSFLVDFSSAVNAVQCALEIQEKFRDYNKDKSEDEKILIRIGIHLGDIIILGNDIIGDGVNIASRIEPFADPGGICISRDVFNQIQGKLDIQVVNLGPKELKNIKDRIEIYKILVDSILKTSSEISSTVSRVPVPLKIIYSKGFRIFFSIAMIFVVLMIGFIVGVKIYGNKNQIVNPPSISPVIEKPQPKTDTGVGKISSQISDDINELIKKLNSPLPIERVESAFKLGEMEEKAISAIPFLIKLLSDNTIVFIPDKEGKRRRTSPSEQAEKALIKIGEPSVEPLISALKEENKTVRIQAIEALGIMKDKRAVKPIIELLKDQDKKIRKISAWALGSIEDPEAVEPLINALGDDDEEVVKSSIWSLAMIKDKKAVYPLIEILKNRNDKLQKTSAWAISIIKHPSSIEPLIGLLKETEGEKQIIIVKLLQKITGQYFGTEVEKWQEWWEQNKESFLVNTY